MIKKLIIIGNILIFNSCVSPPAPEVNLISESIQNGNNSYEYFRIKNLSRQLEKSDIPTIYLYPEMAENQTGLPVLPPSFGIMLANAAQDLAPSVEVYIEKDKFYTVKEDLNKNERAFKIYGGITAYNKDSLSISKGFDFGIAWGKGRGDSDYDSQFRDTDNISTMTLDLIFTQNGKIYTKSTGRIKIHKINRGYDFGLSINGSGVGANAYTTKSEGIHESIRRLIHNALFFMLKDVVERKHFIVNNNFIPTVKNTDYKKEKKEKNNIVSNTKYVSSSNKSYSILTTSSSIDSIDEAENQFLNSIK